MSFVQYYLTIKKLVNKENEDEIINETDEEKEEKVFANFLKEITTKFDQFLDWSNVHYPSLSPKLQKYLLHVKRKCNNGKLPEWAENLEAFEKQRFSQWKTRFLEEIAKENEFISQSSTTVSFTKERKSISQITNPYLEFFNNLIKIVGENMNMDLILVLRQTAMREYAYAIPTLKTLSQIADLVPNKKILEIGAGSGYWAYLLDQIGCDVVACDDFSDGLAQYYFPVVNMGADELMEQSNGSFDDRALLYCWPRCYPGYIHWRGDLVIVICEENVRFELFNEFLHLLINN